MLTERDLELLQGHVDGSLSETRAADVSALLERSAEARLFVEEHTWIWNALGDAWPDADASEDDEDFVGATSAAARATDAPPFPLRRKLAVAAGLLLAVGVFGWSRVVAPERSPALTAEQRDVVRYLHVLRDFDFLQEYQVELDLRGDFDIMRAFGGELESEG